MIKYVILIGGPRPFETQGPIGKFCLGLWTTTENCPLAHLCHPINLCKNYSTSAYYLFHAIPGCFLAIKTKKVELRKNFCLHGMVVYPWAHSPSVSNHFLASDAKWVPGYWDWLWYPGLLPVLVSIVFFPSPSKSRCFFVHYSSPAFGFHSCFFFSTDVSAPIRSTLNLLTFLGEFPGLGLALVPDIVVLKAEHGCAWSRNLV